MTISQLCFGATVGKQTVNLSLIPSLFRVKNCHDNTLLWYLDGLEEHFQLRIHPFSEQYILMSAFLTDFTQLREVNCYNVAGFKNVQVIQLFSKSLDATNEMGFLFKLEICQMLSGRLCQSFRPIYLKDLVPDCFCCC